MLNEMNTWYIREMRPALPRPKRARELSTKNSCKLLTGCPQILVTGAFMAQVNTERLTMEASQLPLVDYRKLPVV
jgi:hypothetical protein